MNKEYLDLSDLACATQVRFLPSERAQVLSREPTPRRTNKGRRILRETWRDTQSFTAPLSCLFSSCRPIEIILSRLGETRARENKSVRGAARSPSMPDQEARRLDGCDPPGGCMTYAEAARQCCSCAIYTRPPHLAGINLHASRPDELDRVSALGKPARCDGKKVSWMNERAAAGRYLLCLKNYLRKGKLSFRLSRIIRYSQVNMHKLSMSVLPFAFLMFKETWNASGRLVLRYKDTRYKEVIYTIAVRKKGRYFSMILAQLLSV